MRAYIFPTVIALAFTAGIAIAQAEDAKPADKSAASDQKPGDKNVSSDQLIKELSPPPGTPPLRFRGLHVLNSQPGGAGSTQMPAVGLDIKFKLGSAELTDEAKDQVRQLAEAMNSEQLSKYHFLVEGHTDSTGRPDANLALSKRRAEAVRSYLVSAYNVPRARLEAIGRGQTMPINSSNPADPANRRVQVVNLGQ
jgi:outer membrane protein OmpA-like peptidoglycan-associated protein